MRIYDFPFAPNPHKLRIYLAEKGLSIPLVRVDLRKGDNQKPEFLAKNPVGGLPVLELDDGSCLTESLAIIEYLEELHPHPPMIGTEPLERARVRELERFVELNVLNRIAQIFLNSSPIFVHRKQVPQAAEQARAERHCPPRSVSLTTGSEGTPSWPVNGRPLPIAPCMRLLSTPSAPMSVLTTRARTSCSGSPRSADVRARGPRPKYTAPVARSGGVRSNQKMFARRRS